MQNVKNKQTDKEFHFFHYDENIVHVTKYMKLLRWTTLSQKMWRKTNLCVLFAIKLYFILLKVLTFEKSKDTADTMLLLLESLELVFTTEKRFGFPRRMTSIKMFIVCLLFVVSISKVTVQTELESNL